MKTPPDISDAEWLVMDVLWERSPLTAAEVVDALATRSDWSPRTVKTLLARLVKKGALGFDEEGNRYLYRPRVTREECVRRESRSFLSRVFGGDPASMLVHFVKTTKLSPAEVEELRRLLDRKER